MPIVAADYMVGSRGTMAVDWERRIDMDRLRRARHAKARRPRPSPLRATTPRCFHYSLLSAGGRITHWDSADHAIHERLTCPWLEDIRYAAPGIGIVSSSLGGGPAVEVLCSKMAQEIVLPLRDHGITTGRIGLDAAHTTCRRAHASRLHGR